MYTSKELLAVLKSSCPEVQSGQFRVKAVAYMKARLPESDWPLMELEAKEMLRGIPDAFTLHEEVNAVTIFEIEVTHPAYKRASQVLDIFSFFDEYEIGCDILTIDAYGRVAPLDVLQLLVHRMRERNDLRAG